LFENKICSGKIQERMEALFLANSLLGLGQTIAQQVQYNSDRDEAKRQRLEDLRRQDEAEKKAKEESARDYNNANVQNSAVQANQQRASRMEWITGLPQGANFVGSV
jgi:hypothetical protein